MPIKNIMSIKNETKIILPYLVFFASKFVNVTKRKTEHSFMKQYDKVLGNNLKDFQVWAFLKVIQN